MVQTCLFGVACEAKLASDWPCVKAKYILAGRQVWLSALPLLC